MDTANKNIKNKNIAQRGVFVVVLFYQKWISPFFGPRCKYYPSCSSYFMQAVGRFGFIKGSIMGIIRLFKCVPWSDGGVDEVPQVLFAKPLFGKIGKAGL
jgi:putative membrane protein insertion efficiency factor